MTNEDVTAARHEHFPRRGEIGYRPILEEEDNQDLGGVDSVPDDEAISLGSTESLGHMEVEDEPPDPEVPMELKDELVAPDDDTSEAEETLSASDIASASRLDPFT